MVKIEMIQEDIDGAERGSTRRCPIARAIKRILYTDNVCIGYGVGIVNDKKIRLTQEMNEFVCRFDMFGNSSVKPIVFEIAL